jgi:hypothetical protein
MVYGGHVTIVPGNRDRIPTDFCNMATVLCIASPIRAAHRREKQAKGRKLKHRCLLTLNQACQENARAVGKFECVMMHLVHVLFDLPKDRPPEVYCFPPSSQTSRTERISPPRKKQALFQEECTPPSWDPPARQTLVYRY